MTYYFAHPEYFWFLLLIPLLLVGYALVQASRNRRIRRLGDEELVKQMMPSPFCCSARRTYSCSCSGS